MTEKLELAKRHFELALNALDENNISQAEIELRSALHYSPLRPSILVNLSAILIRQQKWSEAKKICIQLIELEPTNVEAIINLGICEEHANNLDIALNCFNKALSINSKLPAAWVNKGNMLIEKGALLEAQNCFETALNLDPRSQECLIGLGNLHNETKKWEMGLKYFSDALSINPNNYQAQWNKALSLIRLGKFEEGWRLYESRWHIPGMAEYAKHRNIPLWLGKDSLQNKTILIHAEQGFGDAIQMSRYIPIMANNLGTNVIFEVHPSLMEIMKSLDTNVQIINAQIPTEQQLQNPPDFQCPVMTLPHVFKTRIESIPNQIPYLTASPELRQNWQKRLNNLSKTQNLFRVGITWSGSGHYAGKKNNKRDIPFELIRLLLDSFAAHPIEFHAIQKELSSECIESAPKNLFLHGHSLNTFADTASLISEMDLIVSIDTAVGHLSGALGQKTLLLIPDPPDFMSMVNIETSPWYPNTRFIRQNKRGVWPLEALKRIVLESLKDSNESNCL